MSEDKPDPPVKPEDAIHRKKSSGFPLEFTPYLIRGGNDSYRKLMLHCTSTKGEFIDNVVILPLF
jgi:hypothetical protein